MNEVKLKTLIAISAFLAIAFVSPAVSFGQAEPFQVTLRTRKPVAAEKTVFDVVETEEEWNAQRTAVIVCDMWDAHHCFNAVGRVQKLAPEIEKFLTITRERGATIIHAPSSCVEFYKEHDARKRAQAVPVSTNLPEQISDWCDQIPSESAGKYPIDQSDGGEDDTPADHQRWAKELQGRGLDPKAPWKRQVDTITIDANVDYISDDGKEIWSILEHKNIDHVMMVGVHTNMCVLGRPFGLRRLASNGKQIALVRDLTDSMYNPAAWPYVNHHTGTQLIVEHVEKFVCPTMVSDQVTGATPFRFPSDQRPRLAMLVGEREYETDVSLTKFAVDSLGKDYCVDIIHADGEERNDFPGIARISEADALLISVRRRTLPADQLNVIRDFVAAGKPVIGIRTASHAFCLFKKEDPVPAGLSDWRSFDAEVFGGNYHGHHANESKSELFRVKTDHMASVFKDVELKEITGNGSLYKVSPLMPIAKAILMGRIEGADPEPLAWSFRRADGGQSFYTSLGHRDDFTNPEFAKMLKQAIDWTVQQPGVTK